MYYMHIQHSRVGIHMHAISGIDIALWDIAIQNACWYSMQLMVRPVIFMGALLYMMIDRGTVMI